MDNQFLQFKNKFIDDAQRLIDDLEKDLINLENNPNSIELIESVFRCMHTLKGVCGMYGFDNISEVTHQLENIYDFIREGKLQVSSQIIQITLVSADYIRANLNDKEENASKPDNLVGRIKDSINQILKNSNIDATHKQPKKKTIKKENTFSTWLITFMPDESLITRNVNLVNTFRDLFMLGSYRLTKNEHNQNYSIYLFTDKNYDYIEDALMFILDNCRINKIADFDIFNEDELNKKNIEMQELKNDDASVAIAEETKENQEELVLPLQGEIKVKDFSKNRINVEASKLDELMYLVSELITTNSQLILTTKDAIYNPIRPIFEKIDKLSKQFRNNTISLRLVPINEMVVKFQRLVRDLSKSLGKEIELVSQGTETELDKSTIDALADPIMHIIRNCIDHGIEQPEIRIKNNKPAKGIIKITAFHSGNFVFIQIQDDGQGIDIEKIKKKAIEKNIITPDYNLSEKEAFDIIFMPGFSTAENLTHVSGRGVGMDVVKKKLTELRGQIEVTSEKGLGTSFTIKLNQTLTILDTMLFQADDMFFLVPLSDILECKLITGTELEKRRYTSTISYSGKLIPYIDIYDLFKLNKVNSDKYKLLIINRQENCFAIAADTIIGEHQAVLKSLGEAAKKQPYIAVASVLGDGNLAYLLDINSLQQNLLNKIHN